MIYQDSEILVTGLGIVSALGCGAGSTHDALVGCRSGIGPVSLFPTSLHVPVGSVSLSSRDLKVMLGLNPARVCSRTALLGMLAARQAVDDAGLSSRVASSRVGLVSATSVGGMDLTEVFYRSYRSDPASGRISMVSHHDCADSTDSIARCCGISGFRTTVSTACSSAANAVMMGARLLRAGLLDAVVVGGSDALCRFTLNGFNSLKILDSAHCRPFDASRAGLNLGEGAAYLVLERADSVSIAGPRCCYGSLAGYANANDATHQTATSDDGTGAFLSMSAALRSAGLSPADVDYVNAHGTGTGNNDSSEAAALHRLFCAGSGQSASVGSLPPVSSTKAFTGHTLAAAGAVEAVISLLAIRHQVLYPNLNFSTPMELNPVFPVLSPTPACVSVVMSNSFGFGGNCSTLIFRKA